MKLKLAFAGFRHGHIVSLYQLAQKQDDIEVVAACEEDEAARQEIAARGAVAITHARFKDLLAEVECDAVAVGDYFAGRGRLIIAALEHGKHVIIDKPICTRLSELDRIESLADARGLAIGCMLTLRDSAPMIGLRNLVRAGAIGEVHAIGFGGQHPLLLDSRPAWYFEPGKHGGTINDIGIHAINGIPWITGLEFERIDAARCWNAFAPEFPDFKDGAQMMLTMDNGCGVLGDVSYFMPDRAGYSLPLYWRMTLWGRQGVLETSSTAGEIRVALHDDEGMRSAPLPAGNPGGYLRAFFDDIQGKTSEGQLRTGEVLRAARLALEIQQVADSA